MAFLNVLVLLSFSPQTAMVYQNSSFVSASTLRGIASYAFLASFCQVPSHETYEKLSEKLLLGSTGTVIKKIEQVKSRETRNLNLKLSFRMP